MPKKKMGDSSAPDPMQSTAVKAESCTDNPPPTEKTSTKATKKHSTKADKSQKETEQSTTSPALARPGTPPVEFTEADFTKLADNEHYRYMPNRKKIAHAVIKQKADGSTVAMQYKLPKAKGADAPEVCELTNIEEITRFGMKRYRAKGPDGKPWYARRFDHARIKAQDIDDDAESVDFAYFSEEETSGKEPFFGSKKKLPRFRGDMSDEVRKDFEAETADFAQVTKGGHELVLDAESIQFRDAQPTRTPDQNTVMEESARDAYENYFSEMEDELSPELVEILKRAFKANIRKSPENQYRPEWLHLYGFSLTPATENPQTKDNLGAAGKWANTEMMVLERVAKWFTLNKASTRTTIKTLFSMLRDSELVDKIHFEVNIEVKNRFVRFIQDLDTFKKFPIFRKASDLAQATGITHSILHRKPPIRQDAVTGVGVQVRAAAHQAKTIAKPAPALKADLVTQPVKITSSPSVPAATMQKEQMEIAPTIKQVAPKEQVAVSASTVIPVPMETEETDTVQEQHSEQSDHEKRTFFTGGKAMASSKFPTHLKHEKSVVQVLVTSHEPDYEEPWNGTHLQSSSGTGIVIEHKGEKYVLTNAHVVSNQIRTQIRLANNRQLKVDATPICVSYQADLALLKVKSDKFQAATEPAVLGEMVGLRDEVFTVGFPMGGDEVSITKGIVSRVEVRDYCMSGLDMLQVQVDAAINPGNSGGPVFSNGKVVGVAFQGYNSAQSLGYMIPIPIVEHFLKEVFSGNPYRGFPILPVNFQTLQNKWQREFYGMTKEQTGVLVSKIDLLTDAKDKLKPGDVLMEIDGHKISNEATVDIPGIGNCISFIHLTHMKMVGEKVHLKILRKNAAGVPEPQEVDVVLDHAPLETEVASATEYDKMPSYYLNSGLIFVPVTRNYLDGPGSELAETTIIDPVHGSYQLGDMPKKFPEQQLVAIQSVLDCRTTEGYEGSSNSLVKTVNGKPVKNFKDLIANMESHPGSIHLIETFDGITIALKKMSPEKQALLMSKNKIAYDRSEDLRPPVPGSTHAADVDSDDTGDEAAMPIRIKAATAPSAAPHKEVSVSKKRRRIIESDDEETVDLEETEVSETEEEEEELPIRQKRKPANARVIAKGRVKKGVEEDSTDESEEDEEEEVDANALLGADGLMPGQRRFMQTVGALEQRLKSLPQEEDDDDVLDFDHLTTDEEDDDEEYTPPPRKSERLKNQRNPSESVLKDASKTSSLHVKHSIFAQKRTHSQIERAQEEEATEDLGKESAAKRRRV